MKNILLVAVLQCVCYMGSAQAPSFSSLNSKNPKNVFSRHSMPGTEIQNHVLAPEMIGYNWDTLSSTWIYDKTVYNNYSGNTVTSAYAYDTITGTPLQFDTTGLDSAQRITLMQTQTWNNGWQNNFKIEHVYSDSSPYNRTTWHYQGSGTTWTLSHGDSVYCIMDTSGNIVDYYYFSYNMSTGQFKPENRTLTDYDVLNRVERRRSYQYDTTLAQFVLSFVDSSIVYDPVYIEYQDDAISYDYSSGFPIPHYRNQRQFTGTTAMDRVEIFFLYNLVPQTWDNYQRFNYSGQACDNLDSSLYELWDNAAGWQPMAGSRHVFNFIDSCDYDETIFQNYTLWLQGYRNFYKWVFPPHPFTGIVNVESKQPEISLSPNPFHDKSTIKYPAVLGEQERLRLKIYSVLGFLVRDEIKIPESKGDLREIHLERNNLTDGLYFYELRTTNFELLGSGKLVIE